MCFYSLLICILLLYLTVRFDFTELTAEHSEGRDSDIWGQGNDDRGEGWGLCFLGTGDPGIRKRRPKNTKEVSRQNGLSDRRNKWGGGRGGRKWKTQIMKWEEHGKVGVQSILLNPHTGLVRVDALSWPHRGVRGKFWDMKLSGQLMQTARHKGTLWTQVFLWCDVGRDYDEKRNVQEYKVLGLISRIHG